MPDARVVAVANQKGGVGKTSITCNLAAISASQGLRTLVLDLDVQGGKQVIDLYGEGLVSIFVFPPSWEELERRLRGRGTDTAAAIARREAELRDELAAIPEFDYLVVNDRLEAAVDRLENVAHALGLPVVEAPVPFAWSEDFGHLTGAFGGNLGRKRGRLPGTTETTTAGSRPRQGISLAISDRDNRVVEGSMDVRNRIDHMLFDLPFLCFCHSISLWERLSPRIRAARPSYNP